MRFSLLDALDALPRLVAACGVAVLLAGCSTQVNFEASDKRLATLVGERGQFEIKATGKAGHLVYGPYVALEPGVYRLVVRGTLRGSAKPLATLDVASDKGERVWMVRPIYEQSPKDVIATAAFVIDRPVTDAEFRLFVHEHTVGTFLGYSLKKIE